MRCEKLRVLPAQDLAVHGVGRITPGSTTRPAVKSRLDVTPCKELPARFRALH
jgi:hypothetical protein